MKQRNGGARPAGENYIPTWEQAFQAVELWQSRLGISAPRKRRRHNPGPALLLIVCALLLCALITFRMLLLSGVVRIQDQDVGAAGSPGVYDEIEP